MNECGLEQGFHSSGLSYSLISGSVFPFPPLLLSGGLTTTASVIAPLLLESIRTGIIVLWQPV